MKKLFSILAFALISMGANAQIFCNADGEKLASDTTLVMDEYDEEEVYVPLKGLYIKNDTDTKKSVTVNVKVNKCPSGDFQCCAGTNCHVINEGKSVDYTFDVEAGKSFEFSLTEWNVIEGEYGTCETTFTMGDVAINVNFVYTEDSAVKAVTANAKANSNVNYNVAGQRVSAGTKGVIINSGKKVIK